MNGQSGSDANPKVRRKKSSRKSGTEKDNSILENGPRRRHSPGHGTRRIRSGFARLSTPRVAPHRVDDMEPVAVPAGEGDLAVAAKFALESIDGPGAKSSAAAELDGDRSDKLLRRVLLLRRRRRRRLRR